MNLCRFIQKFIQSQRFFSVRWWRGEVWEILFRCDVLVVLWWSHFSPNNNKWKAMKTSFFSDQIGSKNECFRKFYCQFRWAHFAMTHFDCVIAVAVGMCVSAYIHICAERMFIKVDGFRVCRCAVCHGGYTMTAINGGKCVKKHSQINVKHLIENWYNMCMSMSMDFTYKSVRSFVC